MTVTHCNNIKTESKATTKHNEHMRKGERTRRKEDEGVRTQREISYSKSRCHNHTPDCKLFPLSPIIPNLGIKIAGDFLRIVDGRGFFSLEFTSSSIYKIDPKVVIPITCMVL